MRICHAQIATPSLLEKLLNKLDQEIDAIRTLVNELRTDQNTQNAALTGNYIITNPALAIGSTNTNVGSAAFYYIIGGVPYYKAAVAAGTAPGNDVIPATKFGACALDIGVDGTIDAIEAPANATGYASAALAAAALPAPAAGHARMGYVTATKSDGAFTFGTTALNVANSTVAYTEGTSVWAASASAVSAAAVSDLVKRGK